MEESNSTARTRFKSSTARIPLDYFYRGLFQASDSVKLQIQKATRERDQANANTMQIRTDFEKLLLQSNQDILQLRHQLGSTQNRFHEMESELLNSKKHCLELTEEINRLTREVTPTVLLN